jgi:polar amino acid transport system permease protein
VAPAPSLLAIVGFGQGGWGWQFALGTLVTVEISVCSYAAGILFGLLGAWGRLSRAAIPRRVSTAYTTVVRALPELLLIILLFYSGSELLNRALDLMDLRGTVEISGFATVVITLGFVQGAYMTEVFRGAIQAVPRATVEAAHALALRRWPTFRLVVLPMMLRLALPAMGNLWQSVIKERALVSVVGFSELLSVGKNAASETKQYLSILCFTAAIYFALTLLSNLGFAAAERSMGRAYR